MFRSVMPAVFALLLISSAVAGQSSVVTRLENGRWYDERGGGFRRRTVFVVDGVFRDRAPGKPDAVVDLGGEYVIPPLGDAHTHNLPTVGEYRALERRYLEEGIFYVQVLGNPTREVAAVRRLAAGRADGLDLAFANAALTCTLGHPFMVYEPLAMGIYDPASTNGRLEEIMRSRRGENDSYIFVDDVAELDAKWPRFLAGKPDLVKIMLLDAARQKELAQNGKAGDKGLSASVAEAVVKRAHQSGLRVFAHVETADDFRLAVRIGVDGLAHFPEYGWDGKSPIASDVSDADLRLAASRKVTIVPTAARGELSAVTGFSDGTPVYDETRLARIKARQRRLLRRARSLGVGLALGADLYGRTVMPELLYLRDNDIFDDRTILRLVVSATPRAIFPTRRVGCLVGGCEASFLTLGDDPTKDIRALARIRRRYKLGREVILK